MFQAALISNSFILLMTLNEATQPLTTPRISELISKRSKAQIYKIPASQIHYNTGLNVKVMRRELMAMIRV
jgi:hypothetical protein